MAEENKEIIDEKIDETLTDSEEMDQEETSTEEVIEEIDPISELEEKIQQLEERNLRLQAEVANMQRRNNLDRQEAAKYRSQKLATQLLDVVDNLERALETKSESEDAVAIKKGVEMVYNQLINAFDAEEIKVINPIDEPFNPTFHQAVSTLPAKEGQDKDVVVNVLQKGYSVHDRVLRPAMVIVSN